MRKKLAVYVFSVLLLFGTLFLAEGQIPTILPMNPVTEPITFEKDITIGNPARIIIKGDINDDGIVFASLGTATKAIDLENCGLSGSSDYLMYFSSGNYWRSDGIAQLVSGRFSSDITATTLETNTILELRVGIFATDGTSGQRIMNYSAQDKPLQLSGDALMATANLGSEDVLVGNLLGLPNADAEPGGAFTNGTILYAKDSSDGSANSTFAIYTEQAIETIGTFTASHKMKIWINGTEYWIQLDAVL